MIDYGFNLNSEETRFFVVYKEKTGINTLIICSEFIMTVFILYKFIGVAQL